MQKHARHRTTMNTTHEWPPNKQSARRGKRANIFKNNPTKKSTEKTPCTKKTNCHNKNRNNHNGNHRQAQLRGTKSRLLSPSPTTQWWKTGKQSAQRTIEKPQKKYVQNLRARTPTSATYWRWPHDKTRGSLTTKTEWNICAIKNVAAAATRTREPVTRHPRKQRHPGRPLRHTHGWTT